MADGASGVLAGKVVQVTGAAGGLGDGICAAMTAAGATVVATGRTASKLEQVVAAGHAAVAVPCDVGSRASIEACATEIVERFGRLDVLVNNAAIYPRRPWDEIDEAEWDEVLAVNLKGYFLSARAAAPHMKAAGGGAILNMASITFFVGFPYLLSYISSKGGILGFTRGLARELGPDNITVNAISPGAFQTDAEKIHPDPEGYNAHVLEQQCLKRRGRPEDVGALAVYLASPGGSFITGQTIEIDGGWAMH
jgi:NAD(P)-dependent dehydrogenase (short-subunit alcohol dehydrogenase family)